MHLTDAHNRRCFVAGILVFAAATTTLAAQDESGWKPLFDGKTLNGWIQRGGKATYAVEDGAIVGRTMPKTPNTFLCTDRDYSDFVLELETKVDPSLNSGIQIRSQSRPDYKNGVVHGYQVEVDPSARAWSGGIYDESRRGWLMDLKNNEQGRKAFKPNDWNHYRIEVKGDTFRTFVNGVQTALLVDDMNTSGFIALQVHASTSTLPLDVRWRNIRIRELNDRFDSPSMGAIAPAGAKVLFNGKDLAKWQHADGKPAKWKLLDDGTMEITSGSGNLLTREPIADMQLHLEFLTPEVAGATGQARGNSGVYIQDRYEIQILDTFSTVPLLNGCGAIYTVTAPRINMCAPPDRWQTYDITFRSPAFDAAGTKQTSASVTVLHNGVAIHRDAEIPHATGAAMKKGERPAPGPLVLQNHGSPTRFRNIWVSVLSPRNR